MNKWYLISALIPLLGCGHNLSEEQEATVLTESKKELVVSEKQFLNPLTFESAEKNQSVLLSVPLIKQNPELKYGCEVTSLSMVLHYAGVNVSKMELYQKIAKDPDPIVKSPSGDILKWGDPAVGFVGDMKGNKPGYAVFDKPMEKLVNEYLPRRAVNLTGQPFKDVLKHVGRGFPVVVWTTGDYRLPDRWEAWEHGKQLIKTPLDLHAVVLVGFDAEFVYLNDPLSGKQKVKVEREQFISSWKALSSRAISYK
ncbi:C39 family peptidase [Mesobacillus harenae]|uniref:C39 family peptidase n=1 Tax=Mesobacillus harenae TaxID=2213203 RepID=UPI0015809EAF|nr:C39 family peptidase [Mesobacillus harenae]